MSEKADEYWRHVDLYVGGTEHATGHLIYSRFWNKVLHDYNVSCEEEPYQKLINQGMIQGRSNFVYRVNELRHGQAALEYVLALASLLVVVGILWGLVVAAERHARRSEALVTSDSP